MNTPIDKNAGNTSKTSQAATRGTPFSAALWAKELKEQGWKEATDLTAIELPASGISPKKQGSDALAKNQPSGPERNKEELGTSLYLQQILEEELSNSEMPSKGFTTPTPKEKP